LAAQIGLVALTSCVFLVVSELLQAGSAWYGGGIAMANSGLLYWRRRGLAGNTALSAGRSLVLLYRSALERFVVVAALFVAGMAVLELDALALLTGFIAGQVAFLAAGLRN
jgi:ATP synthase protein I